MHPDQLLQRIAQTLRLDVGPAIAAEYPRTQAFMAAVVLQKLGRQLELADAHRAAEAADLSALQHDLGELISGQAVPAGVGTAVQSVQAVQPNAAAAALCRLIEALYADRAALGAQRFDALLARVRRMLRAQIERRMEYAA